MKITITISNGKNTADVSIGAEILSRIIDMIPRNLENKSFFEMVAKIPSEKLQENIAYIDDMFEDVLDSLSLKAKPTIARNLARNEKMRPKITTEFIKTIISDNSVIDTVIDNLSNYEEVDQDAIFKLLAKNENPDVRLMIAQGYSVPKKYKKTMLNDQDADVRAAAKKSLDSD